MTQITTYEPQYQCSKCFEFFSESYYQAVDGDRCPNCKFPFSQQPNEPPHDIAIKISIGAPKKTKSVCGNCHDTGNITAGFDCLHSNPEWKKLFNTRWKAKYNEHTGVWRGLEDKQIEEIIKFISKTKEESYQSGFMDAIEKCLNVIPLEPELDLYGDGKSEYERTKNYGYKTAILETKIAINNLKFKNI